MMISTGIPVLDWAIFFFVLAVLLYALARWEYWKASDDER